MLVYNGKYNGPPSETLAFVTPEGVPEAMSYLEAYPLGSSAFLLNWKKPEKPNGILTGYTISYQATKDDNSPSGTNTKQTRNPPIIGGDVLSAKLTNLKPDTNYLIFIAANTAAGSSKEFYIERRTNPAGLTSRPGKPTFIWEPIKDGMSVIARVQWLPNKVNKTGVSGAPI